MKAGFVQSIPFADVDVLFVDAGNTLVLMDYALLAEGLAEFGVAVPAQQLHRAEAASRPVLSRYISQGLSTETAETRRYWVGAILAGLADVAAVDALRDRRLAERFTSWIDDARVWRRVFSVVPVATRGALARARAAGIKILVVSNSDGKVEERLASYGLSVLLDGVVDSGVIGIEKPDPRIFRHALRVAGVEPARAVHVGDLYAVDVVGARRAGVYAVLLDPFGDWEGVDCERAPDLAAVVARLLDARTERPRTLGRGV